MKTLFTSVLLLLTVVFAHAQQGSGVITGKVIEKITKASLPGASVRLNVGNRYTISDQTGDYEFLRVPEGTYEVEVIYMGYQAQKQTITVSRGSNAVLNFSLEDGAYAMNQVVVMGDRLRGQARALNQQKNKSNISNIISSDQVGRFPDANVGEALRRVPGVTMQNDQGEARNIIIRGLAPELNSVTLNGDRIPSAEGDNRRVQMDLIPSDMIATIEVNKTLTSDMDADAIGGSVNLITRASPNGERVSATLSSGYNPIRDKALYTGSFVYGNRFANNAIGMVVSGSYNNQNYGSDNVEAVWAKDDFGNAFVEETDIRRYDVQRVRRSVAAALDFKLGTNHTIFANAMYNWRDDRENRYRMRIDDIAPQYNTSNEIIGYRGRVGLQTKGGIDNDRNKMTRLEDQRVQNYSLRGEHLITSGLDMDWTVSYSTAREYRPNERYMLFRQSNRTLDFTGTDEFPVFNATNLNANAVGLNTISENTDLTEESELGAKLNFRVPLSVIEGQKGRLRFGGRLRIKDKDRNNSFTKYTPVTGALIPNLGSIPNTFFDGKNFQAGEQYVPGLFASRAYLASLNLNNTAVFTGEEDPTEFLALNYTAKENIYAGYLRWDQDINDKLSVIAGLRLEHTRINYTGNIIEDEEDLAGTRTSKNNYTDLLPSVTLKYQANDDLVFRGAFTTALARPNYYALTPFVGIIAGDEEIAAGNPNLDATYAYNFDLMAEQYFKSVGLISGGVFYKKLKNFIYTYADRAYTTSKFANDFPDLANPIPAGEQWAFQQDRNGESVNVYGFEVAAQRQLDFLPGKFLRGFGVYANYTFTKSKAKGIANSDGDLRENITLPGTAPHMLNASLSWENSRFSARLSANYTAAYIDELGGDAFGDAYYDKQFFLDANASVKVSKVARFFAEATNLTNQPLRYYQGTVNQTRQMEYYRPRYNLGVKFDF
ncbi:TonB-dependent receptor [Pedobacter xixiisoli]|uniref:TonB-dependent receptor n=1 Tax=Pedobacter xixiisoli TaxID=1476464 RepID=A0A286A0F5_9SPHI|nr:TonB-dependent receptor [Pedobacter xixiisoli]SOD15392.1 TonB-dependent receptor [Pedobacter xixiisoli]